MPRTAPAGTAGREIPLSRLSAYLHALGPLRGQDRVSVPGFIASLQDVTSREFTEDCRSWGLSTTGEDIDYSLLRRAVRGTLLRSRNRELVIDAEPAEIPSEKALLESLRTNDAAVRHAAVIETAYDYAAARPEHFLTSHGTAERGQTAHRHQVEEARKIVEEMLGNGLVVHEVGLGKTITAILVLTELLRRDPDLTVLILVPPNLRKQWADEIALWSSIEITKQDRYDPATLKHDPYLLLTIDTAKEERRAAVLKSRRWGLVLVDEGHWLRNEQTERYRFVYSLRARFRLLLTATPVHNSGYDIFHQVNLVRPGHLGRKTVFAEGFMRDERQITHAHQLQAKLGTVLSQRQRHETDLKFPKRRIEPIVIEQRSDEERRLYTDVLTLLRGIYRWHLGSANFLRRSSGKEEAVSQLVLISMLVLRELASHPLSALKTLAGPLRKKVEQLAAATQATSDLQTLDRKLAGIVDDYPPETFGAGKHQKTDCLIERLPKLAAEYGRVIVYVEFRETQKAIVGRLTQLDKSVLAAAGLRRRPEIISYHGGLSQDEKKHQIERFTAKELKQVWFISTDAGGQGLNLQQGQVVVNFDFPWNPMRVEQRIGRVDRIGQERGTVLIENYITRGTIEEYVYRALRDKLHVCEDVLGRIIPRIFQLDIHPRLATPDDVLGIGQIILGSENEEDLRKRFLQFGSELDPEEAAAGKRWKPKRWGLDE